VSEVDGPDFDWLAKAILYLDSPRPPNPNHPGVSSDDDLRRALAHDVSTRISALSAADKRALVAIVLQTGALRSTATGMEEQIRHARLTKRLVSLGLRERVQPITELHSLPAASPLSRIWHYFGNAGVDWASNKRDERKAYMLACLSEIAYLYLTDRELEQDSRLRLYIPSRAGRLLHRNHARFTIQALQRAGELGEISVIQSDRFAFFVLPIGHIAVIAVRGTVMTDRRDWFADLDALKVAAPNGFYHRGFYDEAHDKLADLVNAVGNAKPLHITGHSLGAAMASILCSIWSGPAKPMTPYVFSSPRFGTKSVAMRLPRYAYMKEGDLVPGLPPKWMGYSDEGADMTIFPNKAPPGSGWQEQLWFRKKLRAHSIEQMRVTLASEIADREFGADCYTTQIAAAIKQMQAKSDELKKAP
jgi:hypothetical protein